MVRSLRPAAVVLDIRLPKLDGWEVLARSRRTRTRRVRWSSSRCSTSAARGFALGAAEYLVKPVSRDEVIPCARAGSPRSGPRSGSSSSSTTTRWRSSSCGPCSSPGLDGARADRGGGRRPRRGSSARRRLVDLLMPGMDGFAVVDAAARRPDDQDVPSSSSPRIDDHRGQESGSTAGSRTSPASRFRLPQGWSPSSAPNVPRRPRHDGTSERHGSSSSRTTSETSSWSGTCSSPRLPGPRGPTAEDGGVAQDRHPDLVLMDLQLPGMRRHRGAARLRDDPRPGPSRSSPSRLRR